MDDFVIFFTEVKCKGNTQITNTEETEKHHRVIRPVSPKQNILEALYKALYIRVQLDRKYQITVRNVTLQSVITILFAV